MVDIKIIRDESVEIIEAINLLGRDHHIEFSAENGDWLMVGIDFLGNIEADIRDEEGNAIPPMPAQAVSIIDNGNGFFGRVYRITQNGVYKLTVCAERASATIVRFGNDTCRALTGYGPPNNTTCFVCKKIVSIAAKSVLAAHGIVIPALGEVDVNMNDIRNITDLLDNDTINQLREEAGNWVPEGVRQRIWEPLHRCFTILQEPILGMFPEALRDPIGWAAKQGCQLINLCAP